MYFDIKIVIDTSSLPPELFVTNIILERKTNSAHSDPST